MTLEGGQKDSGPSDALPLLTQRGEGKEKQKFSV